MITKEGTACMDTIDKAWAEYKEVDPDNIFHEVAGVRFHQAAVSLWIHHIEKSNTAELLRNRHFYLLCVSVSP